MPGATAEAQATAPAPAPGVRGVFGSPIAFANHDELASFGFNAGPSDGQFGAIPTGGGNYVFYGFAASSATCAGTTKVAGAYAFTGTLDHVTGSNGCTRVFGRGDGPQGWIFDKDYAGGGHIRFTDSVGVVAVAGGKADLTNSRTGLLISRVSSVDQSTIGVLFAPQTALGKDVKVLMTTQQALLFGAAFGMGAALLGRLLRSKHGGRG